MGTGPSPSPLVFTLHRLEPCLPRGRIARYRRFDPPGRDRGGRDFQDPRPGASRVPPAGLHSFRRRRIDWCHHIRLTRSRQRQYDGFPPIVRADRGALGWRLAAGIGGRPAGASLRGSGGARLAPRCGDREGKTDPPRTTMHDPRSPQRAAGERPPRPPCPDAIRRASVKSRGGWAP